jgi:hypothetical protein
LGKKDHESYCAAADAILALTKTLEGFGLSTDETAERLKGRGSKLGKQLLTGNEWASSNAIEEAKKAASLVAKLPATVAKDPLLVLATTIRKLGEAHHTLTLVRAFHPTRDVMPVFRQALRMLREIATDLIPQLEHHADVLKAMTWLPGEGPIATASFPAQHYTAKHGIPAGTLNKARRDKRLDAQKRSGRWFYAISAVRALWPDAFEEDDETGRNATKREKPEKAGHF